MSSQKLANSDLTVGDLIEIRASKKNPAYVSKLKGNRPSESFYVPTLITGIWLGLELIDLGVDWVECETFLYEGQRYVLINGSLKKIKQSNT